jgi:CRISPR-associated protein Cmr5
MPEQELQTLSQERAAYAWWKVKEIEEAVTADGTRDDDLRQKYRSEARQLPALIQTNGLGLTLTYLRAKAGDRHFAKLYEHVEGWVKERVEWAETAADLVECIVKNDSLRYRHATQEALALAVWLRRFAEALLPEEKE